MRPSCGTQELALVTVDTRNLRVFRNRQGAGCHDAVGCVDLVTAIGAHCPQRARFVPDRAGHARIELEVFAQIEPLGHEIEVSQELRLAGKLFRPCPLLLDLGGKGEAVVYARQVDASARVTVPVPHAANVAAGLEACNLKSHFAESVNRIHSAEASSDHDHVQPLDPRFPNWRFILIAHVGRFQLVSRNRRGFVGPDHAYRSVSNQAAIFS